MDTLDYETLPPKPMTRSARTIFWKIFAAAAVAGLLISEILNDVLAQFCAGRHASLEEIALFSLGVPASGLAALVARAFLRNDRVGWGYALSLGLLGPTIGAFAVIAFL